MTRSLVPCRMKEVIADLQDAVERADNPRDIDKLFHQRISTLEAKVESIRSDVQATVSDMMEGGGRVLAPSNRLGHDGRWGLGLSTKQEWNTKVKSHMT